MKVLLGLLLLQFLSQAEAQNGCCAAYMMDSPQKVVIETSTVLTSRMRAGEFDNIKVKTCDDQDFNVQLWQRVESEAQAELYRLQWQVQVTPSRIGTDSWTTVQLGQTYRLEEFHRLGLQAIEGERIPVPYDPNPASSVIVSRNDFMNTVIRPMADESFEEYRYRRTFIPYVLICLRDECYNGEQFSQGGLRGPKGEKGDRGEPGAPGSCTLTDELNKLFCDTPDVLQEQLNRIDGSLNDIKERVNEAGGLASRGPVITGICPPGFIPGEYGVGSCFRFFNTTRMSYAEIALNCHTTNRSLPLYLESELEESYVVSIILDTFQAGENEKTIWTAGIFSFKHDEFVWYDKRLSLTKFMAYRNWAPTYPRMDNVQLETCVALKVFRDKTFYWVNVDCRSRYSFICKKPKECL